MSQFEENLERGALGEAIVRHVLSDRGHGHVSVGATLKARTHRGPVVTLDGEELTLPDIEVYVGDKSYYIEAKTYWYAPENRRHKCQVHGVKRRHLEEYRRLGVVRGKRVFLLVVEVSTGVILGKDLDHLVGMGCQCKGCNRGESCITWPDDVVYFDRSQFDVWHQLLTADAQALRDAFQRHSPRTPL